MKKYWKAALLVLTVILGGVCAVNTHLFSAAPFADSYVFDGPSGVFQGQSGNTYVIDGARKEILILNEDLEYVRTIEGGVTDGDSFYYATAVTDGPEGIYVADALYSGEGTIVSAERILRFEPDGSGGEVLCRFDRRDKDSAPRQYGRIKTLMWKDGRLVFAATEEDRTQTGRGQTGGVTVYSYELTTGAVERLSYQLGDSYFLMRFFRNCTLNL